MYITLNFIKYFTIEVECHIIRPAKILLSQTLLNRAKEQLVTFLMPQRKNKNKI